VGLCPIIQRTESSREEGRKGMGGGVRRRWTMMSQLEYLGMGKNRSGKGHVSRKR